MHCMHCGRRQRGRKERVAASGHGHNRSCCLGFLNIATRLLMPLNGLWLRLRMCIEIFRKLYVLWQAAMGQARVHCCG